MKAKRTKIKKFQPAVVVAPAVLRAGEVDPLRMAEPRGWDSFEGFRLRTAACAEPFGIMRFKVWGFHCWFEILTSVLVMQRRLNNK